MSNPTINKITLPSGTVYDIEDSAARAASSNFSMVKCTQASDTPKGVTATSGETSWIGTLEASSDTKGKFYLVPTTTQAGKDSYSEYVTVEDNSDYSWEKLGTTDIKLSDLGSLAYKSSASASYTPDGYVSSSFTGYNLTSTGTYTPSGSITVGGNSGTSFVPEGSIRVHNTAQSGATSYTPSGAVSIPTISVSSAGATTSIKPFGTAGTLPTLTMTVSGDGNLSISFSQGSLPTAGTAVTVKTGDASYTSSRPTFAGDASYFQFSGTAKKFAFSGTQSSVSVTGTPGGTVSSTFSGTAATITAS